MKRANWVLALCTVCGIFSAGTAAAVEAYWELDGNAAAGWLGTTNVTPLTLKVNNTVGWRLLKSTGTPNVVGGYSGNTVSAIEGATIGGGGFGVNPNKVTGAFGTVAGGVKNSAGDRAVVAGGTSNTASGIRSAIGGGYSNTVSGQYATVSGGSSGLARGTYSTVAGGGPSDPTNPTTTNNVAADDYCTVGGGGFNRAGTFETPADLLDTKYATVSGGWYNSASQWYAIVGGGGWNAATGVAATIAGGYKNTASGHTATVSGGSDNMAQGDYSAVGGGSFNLARGTDSTVAGGGPSDPNNQTTTNNVAADYACTVAGGEGNRAGTLEAPADFWDGQYATVSGGLNNNACGAEATVAGGFINTASGDGATVAGGQNNIAYGTWATVLGGNSNIAGGSCSLAAGYRAKTTTAGTFVWADYSAADFNYNTANGFGVRASGGVTFYTNMGLTTGVTVAAGSGTWGSVSDRNAKDEIKPVDAKEVLDKVVNLPVATWKYKTEPGARHMGPMAQDLYAAFGLGDSDKSITTIDADGVALAAIQGLNQRLQEKDAQIQHQKTELEEMKTRLAALEALVQKSFRK